MTQEQTNSRGPVPSFTPVSATNTDTPRQTEFRLVSPAPPPEADSAAPSPTTPVPTVPGQARRTATSDDARDSAGQLADGEELMAGADADADEPPADGGMDEELPPPTTTDRGEPLPSRAYADEPPAYRGLDDEPLLSGVEELRAGWQRARTSFVDNPRGAVAEAAGLADEAAEALAAALRERRQRIRVTWDGDEPTRDTEALRLALLRYQALFSKMVGD
jgi:hypothetical protein